MANFSVTNHGKNGHRRRHRSAATQGTNLVLKNTHTQSTNHRGPHNMLSTDY